MPKKEQRKKRNSLQACDINRGAFFRTLSSNILMRLRNPRPVGVVKEHQSVMRTTGLAGGIDFARCNLISFPF